MFPFTSYEFSIVRWSWNMYMNTVQHRWHVFTEENPINVCAFYITKDVACKNQHHEIEMNLLSK